jgi:hypothetical protein
VGQARAVDADGELSARLLDLGATESAAAGVSTIGRHPLATLEKNSYWIW